jgi:hypothetical protein
MAKYCLICSAARSGSTLLDLMIGGHRRAASLGEVVFLGKTLALGQECSCGALVRDCPAWAAVFDRVLRERQIDMRQTPYSLQQWDARALALVDREFQTRRYVSATKLRGAICDLRYRQKPGPLRVGLPGALRAGLEHTLYLYELISSEWRKEILVDSSKNIHRATAVYEAAPERVRVVFLTRDGRGVYASRRSSGVSPRKSALAWRRYNRRALALLGRNLAPEHLLHVRYEELATCPEETMRRVSDFLQIEFEASMLRPSPEHHHMVNGNAMRLRRDQTLRLDERWKHELDESELETFRRLAGSMNQRLGYA